MSRPFESESVVCEVSLPTNRNQVIDALRRVALDLDRLATSQIPEDSVDIFRLVAASHAVHLALVELEPAG